MSPHSLVNVPPDVLENIAHELALVDVLGPPGHLISLLCVCKHVYYTLTRTSNLFARIFRAKFDISAAHRRLGRNRCRNRHLASQLRLQCMALRRIRHGDVYYSNVEEDFWICYVMMLENDGKNAVQLKEYANLSSFVDRFVRARLHEDNDSTGWPVESPIKSLALWLMWMTIDSERLHNETDEERSEIVKLILPYVVGSFRYNTFYRGDASLENFSLSPSSSSSNDPTNHSISTIHGLYPPPVVCGSTQIQHYGKIIEIACPILSIAAALIHFSRKHVYPIEAPLNVPLNRAHASEIGYTGPTLEDYAELNMTPHARLPPPTTWDWQEQLSDDVKKSIREMENAAPSADWDFDWDRLVLNLDKPRGEPSTFTYEFGTLKGLWAGKMYLPDDLEYFDLIPNADLPEYFSEYYPRLAIRFVYMRLREYHCVSPEKPMFAGDIRNGWCPRSKVVEDGGTVRFFDLDAKCVHKYEEYVEDRPYSHNADTCPTCLYQRDHPNDTDGEDIDDYGDTNSMSIDDNAVDDDDDNSAPSESPADAEVLSEEDERSLEEVFEEEGLGRMKRYSGDDNSYYGDDDDEYDEDFPCNGFKDLVIVGETDNRHGDAWGYYKFHGRIRALDGLIAIVGIPSDRANGIYIFRGYLNGNQNFVGRWRIASQDLDHPPYEGTFTMSKRDESVDALRPTNS